jgi:hypothetical protein
MRRFREKLAGQGTPDQCGRLCATEQGCKGAETRALRLTEQHFVQRLEPQPFVDGEPVALRLGNLLAVLVEEKLVVEAFGRQAAERAADLAREFDRIDQILAGHFIVDAERDQRIAQSGFHCSLQRPPVTGVVTRSLPSRDRRR